MKAQRLLPRVLVLLAVFSVGVIFASMFRATPVLGQPSPGGGKIVFTANRDGNEEIYVMNPDGSGQTNLTNNPANDEEPAWSQDGTQIAFASDRDGNFEICVMNADGSNQHCLTNNRTATGQPDRTLPEDRYPSWSPDGTQIVFMSTRDGNMEIYRMNADGSNAVNLTNNASGDVFPDWQPAGGTSSGTPPLPVGFQVTDIKIGVNPPSYTGGCPTTFTFTAQIYAQGTGNITYRWERSDGATSQVGTAVIGASGFATVSTTWQLGVSGTFWEAVHVLTPNDLVSAKATFTLSCGAPPVAFQVTDIKIGVNPPSYTGTCPTTFTITAQIYAQGTGNITYRWERSDGATSQVGTAVIGASGFATVSTTWQLGVSGTFWEAVHVLTPNDLASAKATFTLSCGAPPVAFQVTDIKIGVNPPSYTGTCPTTFTITAQIYAQGTGNITYRWERSDGATSQVGTAAIGASGFATVGTTWQLGASGTFWYVVHVLTPNNLVSAKATLTLNCSAPPPAAGKVIGIKTNVTPKDYKDVCPTQFTFTGAIITDGPAIVTYRWERSDGGTGPVQTLNFGAAGTQVVQTTWQLGGSGMTFSGWEVIHVLTPNDMYSEKTPTAFDLICTN